VQTTINKAKARLSIPRSGVSSEVYGMFNKRESYVPKFIKKTDEQIQRIKARILQSFLFSGLEQNEVTIVIAAMDERRFKAGEDVIVQGENGDCLYVVETGELNCYKRFVSFS
jgi:cAMP-dependent protein kinase regulator